jgi:hypothetical protein
MVCELVGRRGGEEGEKAFLLEISPDCGLGDINTITRLSARLDGLGDDWALAEVVFSLRRRCRAVLSHVASD